MPHERMEVVVDQVKSRHVPIPYSFHDVFACPHHDDSSNRRKPLQSHWNLGARLQGHAPQLFSTWHVHMNQTCTVMCTIALSPDQVKNIRRIVEYQYRIQF
jgi:hypothetical protein